MSNSQIDPVRQGGPEPHGPAPANNTPAAVGPRWQSLVARILVGLAGLLPFWAVSEASPRPLAMAATCMAIASALTLWRVLAYLPEGTPFPMRLLALWQNPWVLVGERRYFVLPVLILSSIMYVTGRVPTIGVFIVSAIVCGALVVYLGSPHTLVDRIAARLARRTSARAGVRPSQIIDSEVWTQVDLTRPPDGFPATPTGRIVAVVQNQRTKSYGVLIENAGERPQEWSRWSHTTTQWDTPRGLAVVEAHEIWDGRPEAIVTIAMPDLVIVIEGIAGRDVAVANARLLTRSLVTPASTPAEVPAEKQPLFDHVLGYAWLPTLASLVICALLFAFISADSRVGNAEILTLIAVGAFWPPIHVAVLNTLGIVRPHTFRLQHAALRRRAHGVFWFMLLPSLFMTLVLYFGFEGTPWASALGWSTPALCAYGLITIFLIRSPEKPRRRGRIAG